MEPSKIIQHWDPRAMQETGELREGVHYSMDELPALLPKIGLGFSKRALKGILDFRSEGIGHGMDRMSMVEMAMDTLQGLQTTASISAPLQFLQEWLPGMVAILTANRAIDEILGVSTVGSWEDEQVVQQIIEPVGTPVPYGDTTVVPLTSWNLNFEQRTVVRFEQGMRVGVLEEARSARVRVNSGDQKRKACSLMLEIQRNALGFYGYNAGNNKTYGFMTEPNLPAYQNVANTNWATASYLHIVSDLLTAFQTLRTQSQGRIRPNKDATTLAIATNSVDYLATTSDFGVSVWAWLKEFYPNCRVVDAPQLNGANGGANVFYLFADMVPDDEMSSDDRRTFMQIVPAKFQALGVSQQTKAYEEDYANASAGVLLKRPFAVTRWSGI